MRGRDKYNKQHNVSVDKIMKKLKDDMKARRNNNISILNIIRKGQ